MSNLPAFPDLLSFSSLSKASAIEIRVTDELHERLEKIAKATGVKSECLGNACLEAIATYFETSKEISLPIRIVSKSDFEMLSNTTTVEPQRIIGFYPTAYQKNKTKWIPKPSVAASDILSSMCTHLDLYGC